MPKSVAELKRSIHVGTQLRCSHRCWWASRPEHAPASGEEVITVSKVQGNAFAYTGATHSKPGALGWFYWPATTKQIALRADGFDLTSETGELVSRYHYVEATRPDLPHDADCAYRLSGERGECTCNKDSRQSVQDLDSV